MALGRYKAKNFDAHLEKELEPIYTEIIKQIEKIDRSRLSPREYETMHENLCAISEEDCDPMLIAVLREFIMDRYVMIPDDQS